MHIIKDKTLGVVVYSDVVEEYDEAGFVSTANYITVNDHCLYGNESVPK